MQLSIQQTASILGKTCRQTLYMIEQGKLLAKKIGGRWGVERDDLYLDLEQHQRQRNPGLRYTPSRLHCCSAAGWGLPLGSWFSQWCGNLYLDGLDHFIKRHLNIPGYQRYMDDFVLFADDKARLLDARAAIRAWLQDERALRLNPRHLAVMPTHTPAVFLGYRISRAGIASSRKLRRRLPRRLRAAAARGDAALLRTIRSYRGLLLFP